MGLHSVAPANAGLSQSAPVLSDPYLEHTDADAASALDTSNPVASSSVFGSANFDPHAMTPESLLTYLRSRLGRIDAQMDEVFSREQKGEYVRGELHKIQEMLTNLESGENPDDKGTIPTDFAGELLGHIENIGTIDEKLAQSLHDRIYGEGQLMWSDDGQGDDLFITAELEGTKDFLNIVSKDLDSNSQMDMINLQQLMSARQTAIQLATNLVAACGESAKSIAANIR
jgi:hypothetical protein